ncbi:sugar isomerase [Adhaeribacter arboris]|uniref:Sugar isomerase n=1 Tax=Adhaeribacter arboris TaxID=2072846 RepID=A0A2T2YL53_9BACT|nr:SIS domain-containing protein [Adhaeribacter arboris]PSR56246.1 sugar isomerase [Adhaeribacter arboris]
MIKITGVAEPKETKEYLNYSLAELEDQGAIFTAKEISEQPTLWLDTWNLVAQKRYYLESFLEEAYAHPDLEVILTGAGTSAFIGTVLEGPFQRNSGKRTRAIASTDLVSHPEGYFQQDVPTLLISFARSGNSPESKAVVVLADKICRKIYHLIITCNPSGDLVTNKSQNQTAVFLLPPEANDLSLAMTGSFSSMLLAGLLISRLSFIDDLKYQVQKLAEYGKNILKKYTTKLQEVASLDFTRAIFLGSGPLYGTARESDLKVQELTDGNIICKHDSFLGFRHGPKAVIDTHTLLVYLFSNREYVHQYEVDLINNINDGEKGLYRIGIIESAEKDSNLEVDLLIELSDGADKIEEELLAVCSVMPAQMLGFFKALHLKLKPDSPSVSDTITRVVQGVTIYSFDLPAMANASSNTKAAKIIS